ncbi:MAG: SusD/RagB family nutrient-binding outer membrane lipoprotein [Parabacteroides sp.]|nr:SusD/RagB family nutrient-binding outer membrane lipoprotein [Parabacteroides sp.]
MKSIKIVAACSLLMMGMLSGCDLTGINDNPDKPTDDVDYNMNEPRLASTIRGGVIVDGNVEQRLKELQIDFYSQMLIDGGSWGTKNYIMNDEWNALAWDEYMKQIASLNIVIRSSIEKDADLYKNSIAFAKVWRVYVHSLACDKFGPMPFPAYKTVDANPPYKTVEEIYTEYFKELDEAIDMFDADAAPIFSDSAWDVVYKGDINKWKKFANSLRLRFALRLTEVAPLVTIEQARASLESAAGLILNSGDNARLSVKADGSWGGDYNYTMFQISWTTPINMSKSFEKLVSGIGGIAFPAGLKNQSSGVALSSVHPNRVDPRAPIMFQPAIENGDWAGIKYAPKVEQTNTKGYESKKHAEMGFIWRDGAPYKSRPYDLFLSEEVYFLQAELYARNLIAGDAKTAYENGVRASFQTWGAANVEVYLGSSIKNEAGTSAWYNDTQGPGNTVLEKIITQKYIAAFPDMAQEAWSDKRRLNLPRMDVAVHRDPIIYGDDDPNASIKDPRNFIKRIQYPTKEKLINADEYNRGVQMLGGKDNVAANIWWDTNSNYCTSDN